MSPVRTHRYIVFQYLTLVLALTLLLRCGAALLFSSPLPPFIDGFLAAAVLVLVGFLIKELSSSIRQDREPVSQLLEAQEKASDAMTLLEQEALQRKKAEAKLDSTLVAAGMGMWAWDVATNRVEWSPGLHDLFDIPRGSFNSTYQMYMDLIHPEDRESVAQSIQLGLERRVFMSNEHRVTFRDGSIRWLRGQGNVLQDASGKVYAMHGICQDITDRKHAEIELRDAKDKNESANRLKDSILANMSHEIRTPMTAILGFAEILAVHLKDTDDEEYAKIIHEGGTRLLYLLDSIIDLARIEADRLHLEPEVHRLADSLNRVVPMMRLLAEKKGLSLTTESLLPLWVVGDVRREEQVFINIISNAIRFTAKGGITISSSIDESGPQPVAQVHIRDTGVGISSDFLPYVFDEFRQESEGKFRAYNGSGLGLSIVKKLLSKMGGGISIQSRQGEGTVVTISFSLAKEPAGAILSPLMEESYDALSAVQIPYDKWLLVVEDDADCARLIKETVQRYFHVEICATGEEALSRAASGNFHIVLLDIHLTGGGFDGMETMRQLKNLPAYRKVPVIALTAFAMKGDPELFLEAGFDGYQSKPFNPQALRELLFRVAAKAATAG